MKYINAKKIIALISAGLIIVSISGCKEKEENKYSNVSEFNNYKHIENESTSNNIENNELLKNETMVNKETEIITYFEDLEKEVDKYINESNFENLKEKVKNIVITGIDFIFYGKEINGVVFEELTSETKDKIMYIVASIDSKVESKIPGYKESIKGKLGEGYDYVSEKLKEALNYADGKLEEKYGKSYKDTKDKVSEITGDVKEGTSNIYEKITEEIEVEWSKIKDWYEEKTNKG